MRRQNKPILLRSIEENNGQNHIYLTKKSYEILLFLACHVGSFKFI